MREFSILVVEDDDADVLLLRRAFTRASLRESVHFVRSAEKAMDYLEGTAPFEDRAKYPFPNLVLVDLNMPGIDGFQLLRWLRTQFFGHGRPKIAVLTGSCRHQDFEHGHELGADFCLNKTTDLNELVAVIKEMATGGKSRVSRPEGFRVQGSGLRRRRGRGS